MWNGYSIFQIKKRTFAGLFCIGQNTVFIRCTRTQIIALFTPSRAQSSRGINWAWEKNFQLEFLRCRVEPVFSIRSRSEYIKFNGNVT